MSAARSRGFSLVELMVTIAVALLLLVGIARVFITSKQSYRVQESTSRMQENIRITSDYFNRHLRLADFWGGVPASNVTVIGTPLYKGPGSCENSWIANPMAGIVGYTGAAPDPAGAVSDCFDDYNYVANSDVIAIRYANPDIYVNTAALSSGAGALLDYGRLYVRTKVGRDARLFDAGASSQTPTPLNAAIAAVAGDAAEGVFNYQFQNVVFFVQNVNYGNGPVPTLSMLRLTEADLRPDPLVDGIEMLAFTFGLDTNDDLQVDSYREAAAIAVTDWHQVLSVRVSFVARGDELDNVVDTAQYAMTATRCYGPTTSACPMTYSAAAARYQRRLVIQEIQLRNRVRG
ncbi:PilW family protein [Nevskia sp.]|uniref:PilW family protein n=1 Tax=Nevskia sp. TaxID=1929292 RepID=UPI0025D58225|nr:PilW family protein [Nevskia sp.]